MLRGTPMVEARERLPVTSRVYSTVAEWSSGQLMWWCLLSGSDCRGGASPSSSKLSAPNSLHISSIYRRGVGSRRTFPVMKLTCLGEGKVGEKGGLVTPPCFSLDFCHTRILLECPIDLSALLVFLPSVLPSNVDQGRSNSRIPLQANTDTLPSSSGRSSTIRKVDQREDALQSESKRPRPERGRPVDDGPLKKKNHYYKAIEGQYFLDAEPWYKTPDFNVVDIASLNAVIISNPVAMLGLPLIVRDPNFTAKIYATEATAKLGQLMMEEIVAIHTEFKHVYGRSMKSPVPPWLLPELSGALPTEIREKLIGSHDVGQQWNPIYSTVDIRACMARVHRLHYGEEANIDGFLRITPSSSGLCVGSSNWVLKGTNRSLSYLSVSVSKKNHAKPLDISALAGSEVLLLSHWDVLDSSQDESSEAGRKEGLASDNLSADLKAVDITSNELYQLSGGATTSKLSSQRMSPSPSASSVSQVPLGSTGHNSSIIHKLSPHVLLQAAPERSGKSTSDEKEGPGQSGSMITDERIQPICKAAVEALGSGGSVLIPVHFHGLFFELMEEISTQLRSVGLEHVPIYYISPVAEELLAYANTVPEWLCPARQEKLYAGESLFGFVESLQDKRVRCFPSLSSADLLNCWHEPCVVFATHWSLRVGSAVQLLRHWQNNALCLLVLTEPNVDQQLLLAPFMPFTIQVLHLPVSITLRSQDVVSIVQKLKPQQAVVPDLSAAVGQGLDDVKSGLLRFKLWKTVKIPSIADRNNLEVEMSADLALQIQLKQVKTGKIAAAHLRADLQVKDGRWSLDVASPATCYKGLPVQSTPRYQIRWGKVNIDSLLTGLREAGFYDINVIGRTGQDTETVETTDTKAVVIELKSPHQAKIEVSSSKINIHTNEPMVGHLIVEVLNTALNVLS